jgi:hypothetical protein
LGIYAEQFDGDSLLHILIPRLPVANDLFEVVGGDLSTASAGGVDVFVAEMGRAPAEVLNLPVQPGAHRLAPRVKAKAVEDHSCRLERLLKRVASGSGILKAEEVRRAGRAFAISVVWGSKHPLS